jgi:citrate lyase subunit beta/citryl-CoA lyase
MSELSLSFGPIRSELSVPGNDLRKIEKALTLDADAIFLDLEDSVAPDRKESARAVVG